MAIINQEDLQPGMVLESDVKDRNGRVLLCAGNALTGKHLRIFKMWGVTEADIQGVEKEEVEARAASRMDPVLLKSIEEDLRNHFVHADMEHPFNSELFRILTIRFARREAGRSGS